jgi:hypothetical protein
MLIKRVPTLDPTISLAAWVYILNLFDGEDTPYESVHATVSFGVKQWFDAFVDGGKDHDTKVGQPNATSIAYIGRC